MPFKEWRQTWFKEGRVEQYGFLIMLLFIISRVVFALQGGAFMASPLYFAKQYLDPVLLKNDLLRSLLYLHAQPPLFNLFLGIILKVSPLPDLSYELLFKTAGALIPLLFYALLTSLDLHPLLAFLATIFFMFNPTLILYENLLYYTYIEAFLVLLSLFFLLNWGQGKRFLHLALFWSSLLALGMIRSLFHPVFFLLTAGVLFLYLRYIGQEKHLAKHLIFSSLIALVPMGAWCVKNAALYSFFGTSSWQGISLWIKVNGYAPEQIEQFHQSGLVSRMAVLAGHEPFQPINHFYDSNELQDIPCHHPADCNEWRSSGKPNYNHSGYVRLSKQLWKDALSLIIDHPSLFALYTAGSYSLTLWYSSDSVHALFMNNLQIIEPLEKIYRFLYFGFLGIKNKFPTHHLMWVRTILITLIFLLIYAITLIKALSKGTHSLISLVGLFCLIIHAFTLGTSSLIEFGENNRFRFPVDAAFLILLALNVINWKRKESP